MTTATEPSTAAKTSTARLYRVAGIAALVGALAYLVQPIVVFVVNPPTTGANGYPHVADLVALRGLAPLEIVVFTTIGVATFVVALAVYRLGRALGHPSSVPATTGLALGGLAGAGWIGAAATTVASYGLFATNLAEITTDTELQQAAIQTALLGTGMLSIPVLAMTGWFALLATSGRRSGIVGWPLAIVAVVATLVIGVPAVILLLPFGMLILIPAFAVIGIAFLVKSRRL